MTFCSHSPRPLLNSCAFVSNLFPFSFNDFESEISLYPVLWTCYDIDLLTYYLRILTQIDSLVFFFFFHIQGRICCPRINPQDEPSQLTSHELEMSKKYDFYSIKQNYCEREGRKEKERCLGTSILEKRKLEIWKLISLKLSRLGPSGKY